MKQDNVKTENYKQIYISYAPVLLRFAEKFVSSFYAEDIVHDIFMKIWDRQIFLLHDSDLKPLLFAAVRNSCIDYLRRQKLEQKFVDKKALDLKLEELEFWDNSLDLFMRKDLMENITGYVAEMPSRMQEIFNLSYIHGLNSSEIAEKLNISIRTVENQLYRILIRLREHFKSSHQIFLLFLTLFL